MPCGGSSLSVNLILKLGIRMRKLLGKGLPAWWWWVRRYAPLIQALTMGGGGGVTGGMSGAPAPGSILLIQVFT